METSDNAVETSQPDLPVRVVAMRDGGASWKEIEQAFSVTRQQARYAYQVGKRAERRKARRSAHP